MKIANPIFVTGANRSGTTWVGRMIAASPDVGYIHEPFNPNFGIRVCNARFNYWFTYISEHNEDEYYKFIKDTLQFRYNLVPMLKASENLNRMAREIKSSLQFIRYRIRNLRPLLKDPIALFSAEWLVAKFDLKPIILIRHPAAFAESMKAKNWRHPFSHTLEQVELMEEHLYPFQKEIKKYSENEMDIVDHAALQWKLNYYMVLKYMKSNPHWIYIRHEDLSREPIRGFKSIYRRLGLEFSEDVLRFVSRHSMSNPPVGSRTGGSLVYREVQRDSNDNVMNWKNRLSHLEIQRIKSCVSEISKDFYSEDEW